ncbi:MAG TPA: 23S rRNA (guanosine(2251)-2'-O)-methyltransferase RlmB [Bryobacteraceae bacterium]|nr:23S rRNA (guanosine(2251)-2'-O)-methyltransferase RlmB [Bryobacteraceae bacterium]
MSARIGIHPVLEALRARRPLTRVVIAKGLSGPRIQQIIDLCREQSVPVRFEPREALDRLAGGAAHQGVAALGAAHGFVPLEEAAEGAQLLVVLDGVEDPHNLGAIIRTAHAAGASAVVVPERRAVGLTETVAKAAAGALEYLPVARVGNLTQALEQLKRLGFWIYGFDERGQETYDRIDYASPAAFVFGGEGKGVRQGVRKHCDFLVRIPLAGKISSLNVSVAAGIALFEWKRRKGA